MKKLVFILFFMFSPSVYAQTAAMQSLAGFLTTSSCPSGSSVCWKPYSSTNPLPIGVYGGTTGQLLTSNGAGSAATFQGGATGSVTSAGFISGGTKFTTTGSTCGTIGTTVGGATAGTFVSGTTGACTAVITMNGATGLTAPNGWACSANDLTTQADLINQIAPVSTTQATLKGTTASGDVISFSCIGY